MNPLFLSRVIGHQFNFVNIAWLFGILVIPVIWWLNNKRIFSASLKFSSLNNLKGIKKSRKAKIAGNLQYLFYLGLAFLFVALARPQSGTTREESFSEGVDIALSLDISSSMESVDFKPENRLGAAKKVAKEFVQGRENDRIAFIIFAGQSFTQCPLTMDYGMIINFIDQVKIGQIQDGTAIGLGLSTAVSRLANSKSKSKVVILLTDGVNNAGEIDPLTAAQIAKALNIKVYPIGMGKPGGGLIPIDDPIFGRRYQKADFDIDEPLMRKIADLTGGKYYRATDTDKLEAIFAEINEMEKTKIEVSQFTKYKELAPIFLLLGFILIALYLLLENTTFRKLP